MILRAAAARREEEDLWRVIGKDNFVVVDVVLGGIVASPNEWG